MKYGFYINQLAVIDNGLKLDIVDLAIFDCIKDFAASPNCKKLIESERIYYWLKWSWLSKECPILGLNTRQSVTGRYNKLIDAKMLIAHPDNQKLQQAFYCFGENCSLLLSVNKSLHGVNKNVHGVNESLQVRVNESLHTLATDVYTDNNTNNNNTIDNNKGDFEKSQSAKPELKIDGLTAPQIDTTAVPENTNPAFFELLRTFAKLAVKKPKSKRLTIEGWETMCEKFAKASKVVPAEILSEQLKDGIANANKWNTPFYTDWYSKNVTNAKPIYTPPPPPIEDPLQDPKQETLYLQVLDYVKKYNPNFHISRGQFTILYTKHKHDLPVTAITRMIKMKTPEFSTRQTIFEPLMQEVTRMYNKSMEGY